MISDPKPKIYRNKAYLSFIRRHSCIMCDNPNTIAHHVRRSFWGAGTGIKPHDYVTLPLCHSCHDPKVERNILIERKIIDLLMKYIEELR